MKEKLPAAALKQLFTEARSYRVWQDKPVSEELIKELYELLKWGPTSINAGPARFYFLKSAEQKEKILAALMGSNVDQVKTAPVLAIVAYDTNFTEHLHRLYPAFDARPLFKDNAQLTYDTAFRNSSLQGAYMIMAARSLGLDLNPMSGFDNAKVDELFFAGTTLKSNFISTLGYGDDSKLFPRGPRLEFDEVCKIL